MFLSAQIFLEHLRLKKVEHGFFFNREVYQIQTHLQFYRY